MPAAARMGDNAHCPADNHGRDCCPHSVTGPAKTGSPNVTINGQGALRVGDVGEHSACCGSNSWECVGGSGSVFINGIPAARTGDPTKHCGGSGVIIGGSGNVLIGD